MMLFDDSGNPLNKLIWNKVEEMFYWNISVESPINQLPFTMDFILTCQKEISMNNGLFKANIESQKGGAFTIVTPTSVASVKGTEFWVVSKGEEGGDQFFGLSGLVEVRNKKSNEVTRVTKRKTAISRPDGTLELRATRAGEVPVDDTSDGSGSKGTDAGDLKEIRIKLEDESGNQKDLIIKAVE